VEPEDGKPHRGWLRRNWKWVVSVWLGLSLSGGIAAFTMLRHSDATELAIATAESNPALVQQLGSPLKIGWFVSGNINVTPESGQAELAIPVSGPKDRGTIYAEAHKRAGLWHLDLLQFGRSNSDERLELLPHETASPALMPK
jgi:hypothetical protein